MQGLSDGYFIAPYTIGNYLAQAQLDPVDDAHAEARGAIEAVNQQTERLLNINGKRTVDSIHRELGQLMWDYCGMARNESGLKEALQKIPALREEFWENIMISGHNNETNQELEKPNARRRSPAR